MFTSLRVGIACAKGLAVVNNIPIKAFTTLTALSFSVPEIIRQHNNIVIPVIDIRRNELYYQIYKAGSTISKAQITTPEDFCHIIPENSFLLGSGLRNYLDLFKQHTLTKFTAIDVFHPSPVAVAYNTEKCIKNNDISDTASLVPFYIRSV